nr:hypothetical protein [Tanacetum cinerariifolium]
MAEVSTEVPIVEEVGTQEFSVEDVVLADYMSSGEDAKQGNDQEDKSAPIDGQFFYDDEGIDTTYETEYDVQSSEDVGTNNDDDVDEYFLVDEDNEIAEPDVDVHLFGISMDLPFDNIGVTNLVSDDVLEGEDVDVINADGFESDPGNDEEKDYRKRRLAKLRTEMEGVINASGQWKYSFYTSQKFTTPKEAKGKVYLHSIESKRNLKLYNNDDVRIRARCDGKVPVFTMSQGTGLTGLYRRMEAGPSGSSGPTTRSKKRKNTSTNDDSQASSSVLDVHDKGDLCLWTHACLQSKEIKHCTYKFLSEKIFEQVRVNLDIPVKAVRDQLQHELEVQISMSKAFRAKAEREIRGDHKKCLLRCKKKYNDLLASNDVLKQRLETKFKFLNHDNSLEKMIEMIEKEYESNVSKISITSSTFETKNLELVKEMRDKVKCFDEEKNVFETKISKLEKVLAQRVKDFDDVKTELLRRTDKFETYFANLEK